MGKAKGDRRENQAVKILEEAGYEVCTPNYDRYRNTDFFNLFDNMAMRPESKPRYVQVKSNKAEGIQAFADKVRELVNFNHVMVEYWVCHDNEGWRVLRILPEDMNGSSTYETVLDERKHDCNMGEFLTESVTIREG